MFLFFKFLILIFVLILSLLLFFLKIIGGSDGKLIIFIFTVHPLIFLNVNSIFSFFFSFSVFFVIFFTINLIYNNTTKNRNSFVFLCYPDLKSSTFKNVYIKLFYKFFNYSELGNYMEKKHQIRSLDLIYNLKSYKFQILCQIRPPLIIFLVLSYYIIFYVKPIV